MQLSRAAYQEELDTGVIRPASPENFLPKIGQLPVLGGLVLLVAFAGATALAGILKYKVTVKAPAAIRPAGELRIVQSPTEGTVKSIAVEGNQSVRQGDPIAVIDDSRLQTKKNQLNGAIQQTEQQLLQLSSQVAALNSQVDAEMEQARRTITSAKAELNLNQRNYQDKLITTSAEVKEAQASVDLAQEELSRYRQLSGTGAISQVQVTEKEAVLKTAQARLERVKAALNPSTASVEMARERTEQERARGAATVAMLNREREQLLQKQAELRTQIDRDRKELQQVETDLKNTIIRAPVSGVIQELTLRNQSQVVRLGDKIAQIAAGKAPLQIKALVAVQDIGKVKVGQSALMRVSACPYPDYGTLQGQVIAIAPDAIAPSKPASDSTSDQSRAMAGLAYEVTVQPKALSLHANRQECSIQLGMEGNIDIISREETVLQFFLRRARLLTNV
jgi:HlyD family secretion protein